MEILYSILEMISNINLNNELVELFFRLLPYIGIVVSWVYKDRILESLNIKMIEENVENSNLSNIEKNMDLFQKQMDYYEDRSNKIINELSDRLKYIEDEKDKNIKENDFLKDKLNELSNENISLHNDIKKLNNKLDKMNILLNKSMKQVEFYSKNSFISLPKDLE